MHAVISTPESKNTEHGVRFAVRPRLQLTEMRVAFVSSSVPRRCGIATFTADIMAAVRSADPAVRCSVIAIDEPNSARAYGSEVKARIRQREPETYRAAAALINDSSVDVVNIQHEFGLYGVWKDGV